MENISLCTHVINHPVLKNLFIFSTKFSAGKIGAIHIFQCKVGEVGNLSFSQSYLRSFTQDILFEPRHLVFCLQVQIKVEDMADTYLGNALVQ